MTTIATPASDARLRAPLRPGLICTMPRRIGPARPVRFVGGL